MTLEERLPGSPPRIAIRASDAQRALLDRYVRAWETTDVDGFTALLKEDAVMTMPPWKQWYRGPAAIAAFFGRTAGRVALRRSGLCRLRQTASPHLPSTAVGRVPNGDSTRSRC